MTNEELLALATRSDPHSEEERTTILTALKSIPVAEAHEILLKVNQASGESKEPLMRFLADDDELYNKVAAYVKEKFDAENPDDEDDEDEDFEDEEVELVEDEELEDEDLKDEPDED